MNFLNQSKIGDRFFGIAATGLTVIVARIASLALFIFSARNMQTSEYAILVYAIGVSQIIVQIGSLGWLNLIRREAARFDVTLPEQAGGFLLRSFQIPLFSVAVSCLFLLLLSFVFNSDEDLVTSMHYAILLVIPSIFSAIFREYLAGTNRPASSVLFNETIPLIAAASFIVFSKTDSVDACVWFLIVAQTTCMGPQLLLLFPLFARMIQSGNFTYKSWDWSKIAFMTVLGYGGKLLMDRMDTIMIAPLAGMEALAEFNLANRIAGLQLIVPVILIPVFSSRVSDAFAKQDTQRLQREIIWQVAIIVLTSLPFSLLLLLYPNFIVLMSFGEKFANSGDILWLSVLSNLLYSFALPFSALLLMTDGEKAYAMASVFGLSVYAFFGYMMTPKYGIHGAAWVMLTATFVLAFLLISAGIRRLNLKSITV